jgi:hypothetical protein
MLPVLADSKRVWKVPVGIAANLPGASGLQLILTDLDSPNLNLRALRLQQFRVSGELVWGARTAQGSSQSGSQWKYIPIRRLSLFLESSLDEGAQWVVFEPNNQPSWGQIRLNIGSFLQGLFLQGSLRVLHGAASLLGRLWRGQPTPVEHKRRGDPSDDGLRTDGSRNNAADRTRRAASWTRPTTLDRF